MNWTERWEVAAEPTSKGEHRRFGFVMAGGFSVVGVIFFWRDFSLWPYPFWIAIVFGSLSILFPRFLRPIEAAWMGFGEVLGRIVTPVILTVAFFLVITPFGILKRLFSGDTLGLRPDRAAGSYWVAVDPEGSASRYNRPF